MGNADHSEELLRASDVADVCGVALSTVYGWVREGRLRAVDLAGGRAGRPTFRFARSDVDALLAGRAPSSPAEWDAAFRPLVEKLSGEESLEERLVLAAEYLLAHGFERELVKRMLRAALDAEGSL